MKLRCSPSRICLSALFVLVSGALSAEAPNPESPRDPVSIHLIEMDLDNAQSTLQKHDLDDNGSLGDNELKRLGWPQDEIRRFDLNRSGDLQSVEIALKLADARIDDGIVQMDAILADRYTRRYDVDRDGKLTLDELSPNDFTDAPESYDTNSDDELSERELILGLAFERKFRDELGIKGCDQGGAMKLINRGDRDADRRISGEELEQAGLGEEAMKFDRDGNAKLSVSELAESLADRRRKLGLTPSDQLAMRGLLQRLDRNRDGVISSEEVPPTANGPGFAQYDENKDRQITELELETAFGNRRKELGYDDEDADRARILIERNDADRSRTLSREELVASGADRNSPLAPHKLPLVDDDNDGKVSVDELARHLKKTRAPPTRP